MARQRKKKPDLTPAEHVSAQSPVAGTPPLIEPTAEPLPTNDNGARPDGAAGAREPAAAAPDAFGLDTITLGDSNDSPKMRLLRSRKFSQMQIRFDEKPAEQFRARLHEAGWKWRNEEGVWTIQLDKDAKWRTQADAERLFTEIGNAIRADRGLPPVQQLTR